MFGKKFQAKTERRLTEMQRGIDNLNNRLKEQEANNLGGRMKKIEEAQRLAGRKKVRRRDPQTGRFESVYEDELESA